MRTRPFQQVDVFTSSPYCGNPLAVVLDGGELSDAEMQSFARWTNLSETTFLLPPTPAAQAQGADYRVRIFSPSGELDFAGHPTLGSCHAWLQAGGQRRAPQRVVQECHAGLVSIRMDGQRPAFAAPPMKRRAPSPVVLAKIAGALGLKAPQIQSAQLLDNGTTWLGLLLDSVDTVLQITPNDVELKHLGQNVGVVGIDSAPPAPTLIARSNREARAFQVDETATDSDVDSGPTVEVRAFIATVGAPEDPVTGSLNASLAQWLMDEGHLPDHYIAHQGRCLERDGRVHLQRDTQGQVWVGGDSVTCVSGSVQL